MARVDAILRLKGLEEHWKKVRVMLLVSPSHVLCDALEDESISISLEDAYGHMVRQTCMAF